MSNSPLYSVNQATLPDTTFEEDLKLLRETGADGIGLAEEKIPEGTEEALQAAVKDSGLRVAGCLPAHPAPLPLYPPVMYPGPDDPDERVVLMKQSIERLSPFQPDCFITCTGSMEGYSKADAWKIAADSIREVARYAADLGDHRLAVEVVRGDGGFDASFLRNLTDAAEFLDLVDRENVGLCYDVYHLWDTPDIIRLSEELAPRVFNVQISDWREPARSLADRLVPGDGTIDLPALFGALERGGYAGWYEVEIFSDDGRWGSAFEDSLWKLPAQELLRRCRAGFDAQWADRH